MICTDGRKLDEPANYRQMIVYTVHESTGRLGIFMSGAVAKKEHAEFSRNIDLIEVPPPRLYAHAMRQRAPTLAA